MLSAKDNELICRVGPETPMGKTIRRYWVPVATSAELKVDGDPLDVEVLGEHFVAFRDSNGVVGLLAERCCHRGASLLLGRVENCGLRCIYHGWLFAADGSVMETPNVQGEEFKKRVRQPSYRVREAGGVVWAYFGTEAEPPPLPNFPWMDLRPDQYTVVLHLADGNYVQVMEGLLDSTHLGVLHSSNLRKIMNQGQPGRPDPVGGNVFLGDLAPSFEAEDTDYGYRYTALRNLTNPDGSTRRVARVTAWVAPFTVLNASADTASILVPVNDEVTAFFHVYWSNTDAPVRDMSPVGAEESAMAAYKITRATHRDPDRPNRANRWLQDRVSMRTGESFSGYVGLLADDVAVTSSCGLIRDREAENLTASDLGIARLYGRMKDMVHGVTAGEEPLGLRVMDDIGFGRSFQVDLQPGEDWRTMRPTRDAPKATVDA